MIRIQNIWVWCTKEKGLMDNNNYYYLSFKSYFASVFCLLVGWPSSSMLLFRLTPCPKEISNTFIIINVPCTIMPWLLIVIIEGFLFKFNTHFAVRLLCWLPSMHGMKLEMKPKEIQDLVFQWMDRAIHCITRYSLDNSRRFG